MAFQKTYPWKTDAKILAAPPIRKSLQATVAIEGTLAAMIRSALKLPPRFRAGLQIVYGDIDSMGMDEIRHASKLPDFPEGG